MNEPSSFIYIVDRYLEVSNVYNIRMDADITTDYGASGIKQRRLQKLTELIQQGVQAVSKSSQPVRTMKDGCEGGQIVAPTTEFLNNTKRRQEDVLQRIRRIPDWVPQPSNINRAKTLLALKPAEFLGSFPSPGYASDVLSELASWTVCPDVTILAARDMIHMHAFELQRHIMRVVAQAKLISPAHTHGQVSMTIEQLKRLLELDQQQARKEVVEKLVENSAPRDPRELFNELTPLLRGLTSFSGWLDENRCEVTELLLKEVHFFSDPMEEVEFKDAIKVCNFLVVYGLIATYAVWYSCARENEDEMGAFKTNMLFCTRILLDEGRWEVCRAFSVIALKGMRELNNLSGSPNPNAGTGMLTANWFFSRIMCGESLSSMVAEIEEWNVEKMHLRYTFLKKILLEEFEEAGKIAFALLEVSEETGAPNMCIQEFKEWPILAAFRRSDFGKRVILLGESK